MKTRVEVYNELERFGPDAVYPTEEGWTQCVEWAHDDHVTSIYKYGYRWRWWALATGHLRAFLGEPGRLPNKPTGGTG